MQILFDNFKSQRKRSNLHKEALLKHPVAFKRDHCRIFQVFLLFFVKIATF